MSPTNPRNEPDSRPASKEDIKPLEKADAKSKKAIESDRKADRAVNTDTSTQPLRKSVASGYRRIDDRPLL